MKKLLLIFGIIFFISGCSIKPFRLNDEYYSKAEIININSSEEQKLEYSDGSFIVYVYLSGCSTCEAFGRVLDEYINDKKITIYSIEYNEMKKTSMSEHIKYSPSLALFNNGKIVTYLDAASDEDAKYYKNKENLDEWLKKYLLFD